MSDSSRHPEPWNLRSERSRTFVRSSLPSTADAGHGSTNLATVPRAGNISSDTRAGSPG
jgi:hypothetical protein